MWACTSLLVRSASSPKPPLIRDQWGLVIMRSALSTPTAEFGSARSPEPATIMVWNDMPAFLSQSQAAEKIINSTIRAQPRVAVVASPVGAVYSRSRRRSSMA
jgi:hypothetical protein